MAAFRETGGGRREFGRLFIASLAASARADLDERLARGQRLRARRALRRLEELEAALDRLERGEAPLRPPWYARRGAFSAASAVWVATLAVLALAVATHGPSGFVVGALDVVMIVATLAWFCTAVARRRPAPSNEGSSSGDAVR